MTHNEFVTKVVSVHGKTRFTIIGKYTGSKNHISVRCNKCGNEINPVAAELSRSRGNNLCRFCNSKNQSVIATKTSAKVFAKKQSLRLGKKIWQKQAKMYATCIEYLGANDITVIFDNGIKAYHKQWAKFEMGSVSWNHKEEILGKRFTQSNGLTCECIKYVNAHDCNFRFDNGEVVKHRDYNDALKGNIALPSDKFQPIEIDSIIVNNVADFCRIFGMKSTTVHKYLEKGYTLQQIKNIEIRPCKQEVFIDGRRFETMKDVCKEFGLSPSNLCHRLSQGLSIEDAIKIPKHFSFGEKRIKDILTNKGLKENIDFYHNKTLKFIFKQIGMSSIYDEFLYEYAKALDISKDIINRFRFDFAITDNDNIAYFIEVDGIQHFQYIQHFFKIWDRFFERCVSDKNKNSFAELSKIPLLRIRYDQLDHAEEMIDDMLMNPSKYIKQHNTYLSEDEYWNIFERVTIPTAQTVTL